MSDDVVKVTREPHILKCAMTEDEFQYEQQFLMDTLNQMDDLVLEKKAAMSEYKSRGDKLEQTFQDCRVRIRNRAIMRSIECELALNLTRLTATLTRLDTGEVVNERPMTNEEKSLVQQPSLFPDAEVGPEPKPNPEGQDVTSKPETDDGTIPADFEVKNHSDAEEPIPVAPAFMVPEGESLPEDPTLKPSADEDFEYGMEGTAEEGDDDEFSFLND